MIGTSSSGGFDQSIVNWLNDRVHDSDGVVQFFKIITWFGNSLTLTVVSIVAMIVLLVRGRRWPAVYVAVTASLGGLANSALKEVVGRARPVVEHPVAMASGKSFPSGHAMSSTVVYGVLLVVFLPLVAKRWHAPAIAVTVVLVLAIGLSRVALGVHFPSDVVVGHLLGVGLVVGSTALFSGRVRNGAGHPR
jgi:undecaprenyl-diphosphatase